MGSSEVLVDFPQVSAQLSANDSSPESVNGVTARARDSSESPLLYYCGCAEIANPKNEHAITSIINQLCSEATFMASSVAVPKNCQESVRLFDQQSCLVGSFPVSRIVYCKKSVCPDRCFLAFTFLASTDEDVDPCYQCHVLSSPDQAVVDTVMSDFAYVFAQSDTAALKRSNGPLDNCPSTSCSPLSFTFEAQLSIKEKDDKGNLCTSPQEKCCFKLRRSREKLVTFVVSQMSGPRSLVVEKCFGLLLAAGRNVKSADMQLLDVQSMQANQAGQYVIEALWDPCLPPFEVLNTETPRETRVFMTVATDVLFANVPEPLRFSICCRVRVFDENERFWNMKSKPVGERYQLEIQEVPTTSDDAVCEFGVVRFDADNRNLSSMRRSSKGILVNLVAPPDENESDSDEPLLSGSGEVSSECSELVLANWDVCLSKWSDNLDKRPKEIVNLIRNGIPDQLRGDVWQLLAGCHEVPQLSKNYYSLLEKDCPNEQVILRDIHRTFPAHEYFKQSGGVGQEALYKISKAYAIYDVEVGYCQGLSFLAASLLLHMPEERAFTVLVRIMFHYGLRDLFKQGFETLHLRFFQLERLMRDYLPTLSAHFDKLHIETHMFASQWFLTLFTAKFPLSMVFHIIDLFLSEGMNTIFHIALALLKASEQDLLTQDFEGALKYFRVALPRKYKTESTAKELIQCAVQFRISHKRVTKYEEEFIEMRQQEAESQNPLERYQRDNLKLKEEVLRLQRENDDLACELVTSKVHLRNDLDAAEENIESLTSQLERTGRLCKDLQEENRNLLHESEHVKETCRRELLKQEADNKRDRIIIEDYKQMCAELSAKLECLQKKFDEERKRFMEIAEECENCSPRIEECRPAPEEVQRPDGAPEFGIFGSNHCFADQIDQINRLELELAQAKLQLVECECRNQDLMHQLNQCHACHEQKSTWISKTINSIKEAARNPTAPNSKKDVNLTTLWWMQLLFLNFNEPSCRLAQLAELVCQSCAEKWRWPNEQSMFAQFESKTALAVCTMLPPA
uniref:Rab-GAP TBC domain-containing protein n=1 Tax=Trichuris muris TaxID=70415 RepID=A0A5S6R4J5_TRIMR